MSVNAADVTPASSGADISRWIVAQSVAVIILVTLGNILFLAFDGSAQFVGLDHNHLNNLFILYDQARGATGVNHLVPGHGDLQSFFHTTTLAFIRHFGLNLFSVMILPFAGFFLVLLFGFFFGRILCGGRNEGGWLAASSLALSPFIFGLARKFDPSMPMMGFYAGTLLCLALFHRRPTVARAALWCVSVIILLMIPLDGTTRPICAFFAVTPFPFIFIDVIRTKELKARPAAVIAVILAAAAIVGTQFLAPSSAPTGLPWYSLFGVDPFDFLKAVLTGHWSEAGGLARTFEADFLQNIRLLFFPQQQYYASEIQLAGGSSGVLGELPGYFLDMFCNTLLPAGMALFFVAILFFFHSNPGKRGRLWVFVPAFMIAVLCLIPKKRTWYLLDGMVFLPVLAGAGLAVFLSRRSRIVAVATLTLWHAVLATQYVLSVAGALHAAGPAWPKAMKTVGASLDASAGTPRALLREFLDRFDELFPDGRTVRLGILVPAGEPFAVAPFFLRASGKPLTIAFAAMPDAPELGAGLDAVLFLPYRAQGYTEAVLDDEALFQTLYVDDIFRIMQGEPYHPTTPPSPELTRGRLALWKSGRVVALGNGALVFLPPQASP